MFSLKCMWFSDTGKKTCQPVVELSTREQTKCSSEPVRVGRSFFCLNVKTHAGKIPLLRRMRWMASVFGSLGNEVLWHLVPWLHRLWPENWCAFKVLSIPFLFSFEFWEIRRWHLSGWHFPPPIYSKCLTSSRLKQIGLWKCLPLVASDLHSYFQYLFLRCDLCSSFYRWNELFNKYLQSVSWI